MQDRRRNVFVPVIGVTHEDAIGHDDVAAD